MGTINQTTSETSTEAIHMASEHAKAVEVARTAQIEALLSSEQLASTIEGAVIKALNRGAVDNKYVDVGRIPFICDDIRGIHQLLAVLNDRFTLVQRIVFGFISVILLGVLGTVGTVIVMTLSQ